MDRATPLSSSAGSATFGVAEARGWLASADMLEAENRPVHDWLIERLAVRVTDRILELACGTGGLGLKLALRLGPTGHLTCSDISDPMLDAARVRFRDASLGKNVTLSKFDAQQIPLADRTVDGAVCCCGLMLMESPERAVSEAWRVLRPSRRFALSVWAGRERNPWRPILEQALGWNPSSPRAAESRARGLFALGDPDRVRGLLRHAGFTAIELESVSVPHRYDSAADWWDAELGLSERRRSDFERLGPAGRERAKGEAFAHVAEYRKPDGRVEIPAEMIVAVGTRSS